METKHALSVLVVMVAVVNSFGQVTVFDYDATIAEGDDYDVVVIKEDTTVVTMTGGTVRKLITTNDSTFNMTGGACQEIIAHNTSEWRL